jgi:uncharacterized protein DUF6494
MKGTAMPEYEPGQANDHSTPARNPENPAGRGPPATTIDPEAFNLSVRKFLKMIGVSSQREIEQAVERALQQGRVSGRESLAAQVTLDIPALGLKVPFAGEIRLK